MSSWWIGNGTLHIYNWKYVVLYFFRYLNESLIDDHWWPLWSSHLSSGDIPENMKVARVSPLMKKPSLDSKHLQNYRQISNLSFLSKSLDMVVAFNLQPYMDTHELRNPTQSAYRVGHGTETALARAQNCLLCAMDMDKHGVAILVLLDLSAANLIVFQDNSLSMSSQMNRIFQSASFI